MVRMARRSAAPTAALALAVAALSMSLSLPRAADGARFGATEQVASAGPGGSTAGGVEAAVSASGARADNPKVAIDLFVMSRCPDALACEDRIAEVLDVIGGYTEVKMHYIANASETGEETICKHGPMECAGNVQQLCVQKHAPNALWPFVRCQDAHPDSIGEPALAKRCLHEVMPHLAPADAYFSEMCFKNEEGAALLEASALDTHARGVRMSCTVHVAGSDQCLSRGDDYYEEGRGDGGATESVRGAQGRAASGEDAWEECSSETSVDAYVDTVCRRLKEQTGDTAPLCGEGWRR